MQAPGISTLLFTDIEGSTRLWEQEGERMSRALAEHDSLSRKAVEGNGGVIVKMTGDGMYAAIVRATKPLVDIPAEARPSMPAMPLPLSLVAADGCGCGSGGCC